MKLSVSNIAWNESFNDTIYEYLAQEDYTGIEIAPKKIFPNFPDVNPDELIEFKNSINKKYHLIISSMQGIWYGITENIFSSAQERAFLLDYTKKIIISAEYLECKNIVFGCPKNRAFAGKLDNGIAESFFYELGCYAEKHNTVIALEPNPIIYNTNFLNTTKDVIDFISNANCYGLKINVDLGTIIYNNEKLDNIIDNITFINHVHISEPNLEHIQKRAIHEELALILRDNKYKNYVSIEMKEQNNINKVMDVIKYIKSIFNE